MAEYKKVCVDCGVKFTARGNSAQYCQACRKKRQNESWKKASALNKSVIQAQQAANKPQYSFKPAKCPVDCWYRQTISGGVPLCGYVLVEGELRGCDPGPGCKRYVGKNKNLEQTKHRRVTWDVDGGKKLWQAGWKDNLIAKALGIRREAVRSYRVRVWEKENNND